MTQIDIRLKSGHKVKLAQKQIDNLIGKYQPNNVVFETILLFFNLTDQHSEVPSHEPSSEKFLPQRRVHIDTKS